MPRSVSSYRFGLSTNRLLTRDFLNDTLYRAIDALNLLPYFDYSEEQVATRLESIYAGVFEEDGQQHTQDMPVLSVCLIRFSKDSASADMTALCVDLKVRSWTHSLILSGR